MSESSAVRVIVMHESYGCDTGCCGHVVRVERGGRKTWESGFNFDHPGIGVDPREFARHLVAEELGPEHVADLDWPESIVMED